MKNRSASRSGFINRRVLTGSALCSIGLLLALRAFALSPGQTAPAPEEQPQAQAIQVGMSYHNDVSLPLRDLAPLFPLQGNGEKEEREANPNPLIPNNHVNEEDPVVQSSFYLRNLAPNIPGPVLNFDGIPYPGVGCNCSPPDTNGAVGAAQYVQMVNEGYQVFSKTTGGSLLGPASIVSLWSGFGGACQTGGFGDPVVLYDKLANRWLISQFASATGGTPITDQCIAISTTSDATGSYNRYGFHMGSNFFDYPHLGVWPDAYYMADNVFNSGGTARLGPQAFAFDRTAMLNGNPATFVTPGITGGGTDPYFLPSDFDGFVAPPAGAPNSFVSWPTGGVYRVYHFHADFATPANTTFTLFATPAAAGFTQLCSGTRSCVPQSGTTVRLDGIGDRLMHRLAYRNFGDHESVVANYTVSASSVAAIRWIELRNVTSGPVTVFQESTYQPDTTWRWMGSIAMDQTGNMALGYSASSSTIFPSIRYTGRLANDPINTLPQGEATLIAGTGSQTSSGSRWGDYSAMTVDPVDDCTFWYTQEYYTATASVNWRTRIGNFKFTQCTSTPTPVIIASGSTITSESCAPANNVIDPGETVTVNFGLSNGGTANTNNLVATLQATGGVTSPSGPQSYGVLVAGGATVTQPFTFTAGTSCGQTLTATLQLQDGATNLGTVTFTFVSGTPFSITIFSENFDSVTAPALPAGWVATNVQGAAPLWVTSTTTPDTAPNDAFVNDPTSITDKVLDSAPFAVSSTAAQVSFRNFYNLESTFDGGVLEVSSPNINGGTFTDITNAAVGGSFVSGSYNATISTAFSSPISGRSAWSGNSGSYITTVANLGPNVSGQTIKLRFRMASDNGVSAAGWRVDTIRVSVNGFTCCGGPTPTPAPTGTPTPVPTASPTPSPAPTTSPSPSPTPSPAPTVSPSPSPTSSPAPTASPSSTPTPVPTESPSPSPSPTASPSPSPTSSPSPTASPSPSPTSSPAPTASPSPSPTSSPAPTPTPSPSSPAPPTPSPSPSPTSSPAPTASPSPSPTPVLTVTVSLPIGTVDTATTNFTQPVTCSAISASDNLIGFQGDFTFDSTVVTFQAPPIAGAGLTGSNWTVSGNILPGGGPTRTLRISAFSNDGVTPLSGSGTLFNLNMTRVSSTPGASTPLTWAASPNDFEFINSDLDIRTPNNTPAGSITIIAAPISISGNVDYCPNPSLNPVPGVTMTLTGSASGSTATDASGNYSFTSLASGGSYTVTPTKAALAPGSANISTVDVVAVQRHFLGITLIPAGCRLTAADVNGDTNVNTVDVVAIQRFFLGFSTGTANVGKYSFSPAGRSYPTVSGDQTGQNYDALVFGDVASGFVHRPTSDQETAKDGNGELAPTVAKIALPQITDGSRNNFNAAMTTTAIDRTNQLVGFQGDLTFDERTITFASEPVRKAGLTARNWNVSGNVLPGSGPIRTLRISAYSTDFAPLSGEGTLFELRISKANARGTGGMLSWAASPNQFMFIDAELRTQNPGSAEPGSIISKK